MNPEEMLVSLSTRTPADKLLPSIPKKAPTDDGTAARDGGEDVIELAQSPEEPSTTPERGQDSLVTASSSVGVVKLTASTSSTVPFKPKDQKRTIKRRNNNMEARVGFKGPAYLRAYLLWFNSLRAW